MGIIDDCFDIQSFNTLTTVCVCIMMDVYPIDHSSQLQNLDTAKFNRFHFRAIIISGTVGEFIFG